ncbi:DUF1818 family protein [Gloeobacter kilaueensis]|uniref:DUF1818 domain-containing protein n=1 Tax=Gloeobacter kilaueensis (strain ATCC BAA-2537 / CCAP 1431/1 / ULC 316 / JS1) TaxID=1183438 RepID=U5QJ49_GLOK1|nr:DUF1818 family protein [Gloeobacter kilaueensis]AGY58936.1 hypothetical protein GKIL_2690 [Gloeobacter kilaueensis JS1]
MNFWREAEGWIVAWESERTPYCTLVGGRDWSFELTLLETRQLLHTAEWLQRQWQASLRELMDEEALSCTAGNAALELEMSGTEHVWQLKLRLVGGRGAEGSWVSPDAAQVLAVLAELGGTGLLSFEGQETMNQDAQRVST